MKGQYRGKNEKRKPLFEQASSLAKKLGKVSYVHKLRDENKLADRLANLAMDRKGDVDDID